MSTSTDGIQIVMPVFDGMDMLDVFGPFALLNSQIDKGLKPILASADGCSVKTWQGVVVEAQAKLSDLDGAPVVWVPGGYGDDYFKQIDHKAAIPQWLKKNEATFKWVCSVCTGAFVLASSGLLNGYTVTTHWMYQQEIELFPGVKLASGYPRYWVDGNRITGGGVSSGLDASLALISILLSPDDAMDAQLSNQYAPNPPFQAGTPDIAPPQVMGAYFAGNPNPGIEMRHAVEKCLKNW